MADNVAYRPPIGFYFTVEIVGLSNADPIGFQEVRGLSFDIQTEEIVHGGDITPYKVPTSIRYPNLVLKKGLIPKNSSHTKGSALFDWCQTSVTDQFKIKAYNINIQLLDRQQNPLASWTVIRAYPVKFEVSEFNAEQNAIVFETVELCYKRFQVESPN